MLRTVLTIGLFAVIGIVALKLVFGLVVPLLGAFFWLAGVALQIALVGLVVYLVIRVVSPETAHRIRARFGR